MTGDLVERVARAIYETVERETYCAENPKKLSNVWVDGDVDFESCAFNAIRAVLDAIAEPSEAMHHAARDWSRVKYGQPIGKDASDGCWRAMIAALRKEIEP